MKQSERLKVVDPEAKKGPDWKLVISRLIGIVSLVYIVYFLFSHFS
jgi:hypothetical protein